MNSRPDPADAAGPVGDADVAALFGSTLAVVGAGQLEEAICALDWSPDGSRIVAGSLGGEVAVCGADGHLLARLDTAAPVLDACWSPTGDVVAAACEDGSVWLWTHGASPVRHAVGAPAERLAWGDGGLAVATGDAVVVFAGPGEGRVDLPVPPGGAVVVAWTGPGPGAALLAGGLGGLREVLVAGPGGEFWPRAAIVALAVDPASGVVAAGTLGGDVEIGRHGPTLRVGRDAISALAWSSHGSMLAAVADGRLAVWTLRTADGAMIGLHRLAGHDDWVTDAAFAPTGPLLASVGVDGRVALWNPAQTSDPLARVELAGPLASLSWRPDSRALVAGGRDGVLTVVDCSQLALG